MCVCIYIYMCVCVCVPIAHQYLPDYRRLGLASAALVLGVVSGPASRSPSFFHVCVLLVMIVLVAVYVVARAFSLAGFSQTKSNALGALFTFLWFKIFDVFSPLRFLYSLVKNETDPVLGVSLLLWAGAAAVLTLTFAYLAVISLFPYTLERSLLVRVALTLVMVLFILSVFEGQVLVGGSVALATLVVLSEPVLAAIWSLVHFVWEKLVAVLGHPRPRQLLTQEQYEDQGRECTADAMSEILHSLRGKSALELSSTLLSLSGPAREAMLKFLVTGSAAAALDPRQPSGGGAFGSGENGHPADDGDLFESSEPEEADVIFAGEQPGQPAQPSAAGPPPQSASSRADARASGLRATPAASSKAIRRNAGQGTTAASPTPRLRPRDTFDSTARRSTNGNNNSDSERWQDYHLSPPNWSIQRPATTVPTVGAHGTQGVRPPALARVQAAAAGSPAGNSSPMSVNSSPAQ
jgi:hypothetical protein